MSRTLKLIVWPEAGPRGDRWLVSEDEEGHCLPIHNYGKKKVSLEEALCDFIFTQLRPALLDLFNCDALKMYRRDDNTKWDAPEIAAARTALIALGGWAFGTPAPY